MDGLWQPTDGAELWCHGMRQVGRRTLSGDERAALERRARRSLGRWVLAVLGLPTVLALPFVVAWVLGPRYNDSFGTALGIIAFVMWIGGVPVLLMTAHDQWRARARLLRDARGAEAHVFEGRPDPEAASARKLAPVLRAVDDHADDVSPRRLEVLPESRAAVAFGASAAPILVPVAVVEVAAAPAYAWRLPIPEEWRSATPEPGREFLRRALNDAERGEIETMIRRMRRPQLGTVVVAIFGVLAFASRLQGVDGRGRDGEGAGSLLFTMAVGVYVLYIYARGVRVAHRLKRDAEVGIVITAQREQAPATAPASPTDAEDENTIEFLPFSQLVWNRDGRPASWRQLRRAA